MGRIYKPWYYDRHRVKRHAKKWYAEWTDVDHKTKRRCVSLVKAEATEFLAKQEAAVARQRAGLAPAPDAQARLGKLDKLLAEYLQVLAARNTKETYRDDVDDRLTRILAGCGWHSFADMQGDGLLRFLGDWRELHKTAPATLNGYIRTAKAFAKWLAERLDALSPLRKVKPFPEDVDRRRSKRILTDAELAALIDAAERCPPRYSTFSGKDRGMLYRVAAFTGLRASELASLTPQHFQLDAVPPQVTVAAADAKGKREEPIPLPAHLVPLLRTWLAGRRPTARLWPGNWARYRHQVKWIERDVKRAGIAVLDDRGRRITFHSFKRRYVVGLIMAGGRIHEVRRLARHKDSRTTLNYYTDEGMSDLAKLADRLPPCLGGPLAEKVVQRVTV